MGIVHYPIGNMYHVNHPEIFLNRREFPVDDPVWFDAESVANGEDAVVNKAMEWIQNLSYAHEARVNPWLYPARDRGSDPDCKG